MKNAVFWCVTLCGSCKNQPDTIPSKADFNNPCCSVVVCSTNAFCRSVYDISLVVLSKLFERSWPLLWSSGQSSWLQTQRSRVRFQALLHFVYSIRSEARRTQACEDNCGVT
jgi:hypothetical protein